MANNIDVSEGTGRTVKTDEIAGVNYQGIKLFSAAEDSTEAIEGTAANGLEVDVTRVAPGFAAANLGKRVNDAFADADVGVMALAIRDDALSTLTPADGDYVGLRVDSQGRLYVNVDSGAAVLTVNNQPATSGGCSYDNWVSASGTNATNVKASAGQLYGYYLYNANAAMMKIAFHNSAGTPTAGASVVFQVPIPPGAAANLWMPQGMAFATGIAFTLVTGIAESNASGVAANDIAVGLWWK